MRKLIVALVLATPIFAQQPVDLFAGKSITWQKTRSIEKLFQQDDLIRSCATFKVGQVTLLTKTADGKEKTLKVGNERANQFVEEFKESLGRFLYPSCSVVESNSDFTIDLNFMDFTAPSAMAAGLLGGFAPSERLAFQLAVYDSKKVLLFGVQSEVVAKSIDKNRPYDDLLSVRIQDTINEILVSKAFRNNLPRCKSQYFDIRDDELFAKLPVLSSEDQVRLLRTISAINLASSSDAMNKWLAAKNNLEDARDIMSAIHEEEFTHRRDKVVLYYRNIDFIDTNKYGPVTEEMYNIAAVLNVYRNWRGSANASILEKCIADKKLEYKQRIRRQTAQLLLENNGFAIGQEAIQRKAQIFREKFINMWEKFSAD